MHKGKKALKYSSYEVLCKESLLIPDGGFTHLFLIMTWNLMCRSKSTETIRIDHISGEEDAIGVQFFKTKTSQEGNLNENMNLKLLCTRAEAKRSPALLRKSI